MAYCISAEFPLGVGPLDLLSMPSFFFEELCSDEHLDPFEHESFDMLDLHYLPCPSPSQEEYAGAALSLERSF